MSDTEFAILVVYGIGVLAFIAIGSGHYAKVYGLDGKAPAREWVTFLAVTAAWPVVVAAAMLAGLMVFVREGRFAE